MTLLPFQSASINVFAAAGMALAANTAAASTTFTVSSETYIAISVLLSLVGVYLARLVTIDTENKRLGRVQTLRETGPLTWIGILVVGPLVWHYNLAIPWGVMAGLGFGYSIKIVLKLLGGGAVAAIKGMIGGAARAIAQEGLEGAKPVETKPDEFGDLIRRLDEAAPDVPRLPPPSPPAD